MNTITYCKLNNSLFELIKVVYLINIIWVKIIKTNKEIKSAISKVSQSINKDYLNKEIYFIKLNNSPNYLVDDLVGKLKVKYKILDLKFENYIEASFSGEVKIIEDLSEPIENKNILMVDGIIISGITHNYIYNYLLGRKAKTISILSVGMKISSSINIPKSYTLFKFTDEWVEGYGFGSEMYKEKKYLVNVKLSI